MPAAPTLIIRMSVPAGGELRGVAPELAARVAEFLDPAHDSASVAAALEGVASQVAPPGTDTDIEFEVHRVDGDVLIKARCASRTAEAQCRLPA